VSYSASLPACCCVADDLTDGIGAALLELLTGVGALSAETGRGEVAVVVEVTPVDAVH
jgi:hypothetical protein